MSDSCQSSRLTYEALPPTLILDPALLRLAGQSYNQNTKTFEIKGLDFLLKLQHLFCLTIYSIYAALTSY